MNYNSTTVFIGIVVVAVALLLTINFFSVFSEPDSNKYIAHKDVRGIAVVHQNKEYPLDSSRQAEVLSILNNAARLKKGTVSESEKVNFPYSKVIIYRFKKPEVEIIPIKFVDLQMIFYCKDWNPDGGMLQEVGPGDLNAILESAYN